MEVVADAAVEVAADVVDAVLVDVDLEVEAVVVMAAVAVDAFRGKIWSMHRKGSQNIFFNNKCAELNCFKIGFIQ